MYIFRLWKKNKDKKKIAYLNQQRLNEISKMFNGINLVNVDHLEDTEVNYNMYLNTYKRRYFQKKIMLM